MAGRRPGFSFWGVPPVPRKLRRLSLCVLLVTSICFAAHLVIMYVSSGQDTTRVTTNDRRDAWSVDRLHSAREVQTSRPQELLDRTPARTVTTHLLSFPIFNQTTDQEVVHKERVQHLRDACKMMCTTNGTTTTLALDLPAQSKVETDFFVSTVHKLVYCPVQKVASSFWKRAFRVLNNVEPPRSLFQQSGLSSHVHNENITFHNRTAQWRQRQLRDSVKFLFVRDPFTRTFSGYLDKLFLPFGASAVEISNETVSVSGQDGESAAQSRVQCRLRLPTFAKFIHSSVSSNESLFTFENHFTPMHTHCNPCTVPFDIVGKVETFRADTEYVLSKAGVKLADIADDPATFDARSDLTTMWDVTWRTLISPAWKRLKAHPSCGMARHEVLTRLWTVFQARGLLSASVRYPLIADQSSKAVVSDLLLGVKNGYDASGPRARRLHQRETAMMEAYSSVALDDLKRLQALHSTDCSLFGYDCSLDRFVQARNNSLLPDYRFFKDWE